MSAVDWRNSTPSSQLNPDPAVPGTLERCNVSVGTGQIQARNSDMNKVFVVTVEQTYASHFYVAGATTDFDEAKRIAAKHAGDARIYACTGEDVEEVTV